MYKLLIRVSGAVCSCYVSFAMFTRNERAKNQNFSVAYLCVVCLGGRGQFLGPHNPVYVSDKMSDGYDGFMCPQASSKASDAVAAETKSDEDADN